MSRFLWIFFCQNPFGQQKRFKIHIRGCDWVNCQYNFFLLYVHRNSYARFNSLNLPLSQIRWSVGYLLKKVRAANKFFFSSAVNRWLCAVNVLLHKCPENLWTKLLLKALLVPSFNYYWKQLIGSPYFVLIKGFFCLLRMKQNRTRVKKIRSSGEKGANFKSRKKSCSWKLFIFFTLVNERSLCEYKYQ